jgi:hypothetical protein
MSSRAKSSQVIDQAVKAVLSCYCFLTSTACTSPAAFFVVPDADSNVDAAMSTDPSCFPKHHRFRKIKSDPLRLKDAMEDVESKYWKFGHEFFREGRPDLLAEIRKPSPSAENVEKQEVEKVKNEIADLKQRLAVMTKQYEQAKQLVRTLTELDDAVMPPPVPYKKARTEEYHPYSDMYLPPQTDFYNGMAYDMSYKLPVKPGPLMERIESIGVKSLIAHDDDFMTTFHEPHWDEDPFHIDLSHVQYSTAGRVDEKALEKLCSAVASLPVQLQPSFVDQIAYTIADPIMYGKQVDDMASLANKVAEESHKQTKPSTYHDTAKFSSLLGAVVGAYLS